MIPFDKYTDENDVPICGLCDFEPAAFCLESVRDREAERWEPGPNCRVWCPEAAKPTDQCHECDWHPVAGLSGWWCYMFWDQPTGVCIKFKLRGK